MEHCNVPPKILSKFLGRSDLKSKAIQIFRLQPLPWPTLPPPAPRPCPGPPIIINPASLLQPTSSPGHHSHKQILTKRKKCSQVTSGGGKSILDVQPHLFPSCIKKLPTSEDKKPVSEVVRLTSKFERPARKRCDVGLNKCEEREKR